MVLGFDGLDFVATLTEQLAVPDLVRDLHEVTGGEIREPLEIPVNMVDLEVFGGSASITLTT